MTQKIYLDALRRLPATFDFGGHWGEEQTEGCLWIAEPEHDNVLQEIRTCMNTDLGYMNGLTTKYLAEARIWTTDGVSYSDQLTREECVQSTTWFAQAWLTPLPVVRSVLAWAFPESSVESMLTHVLSARSQMLGIGNYTRPELSGSEFEYVEPDLTSLDARLSEALSPAAYRLVSAQIAWLSACARFDELRRFSVSRSISRKGFGE
ncbi:MAG: hypothetical protein KC435_08620 [Thermomicrobiales bacterium]|nr:hypothetical protein [Thermomicrobiales bacterium]